MVKKRRPDQTPFMEAPAYGRSLAGLTINLLVKEIPRAVAFQRLARRLCPECSRSADDPADFLALDVTRASLPVGCPSCAGTGYRGRLVIAELIRPGRGTLARAVLARADLEGLDDAAQRDGVVSRWRRAALAVEAGATSPAEIRRVLGLGE